MKQILVFISDFTISKSEFFAHKYVITTKPKSKSYSGEAYSDKEKVKTDLTFSLLHV